MQKENSSFKSVLVNDLKRGVRQNKLKYLTIVLFVGACCLILNRMVQIKINNGIISGKPNFIDYLLFMFEGCAQFKADNKSIFNLPPIWMFLQFMGSFLVYSYVMKDLDKQGLITLIKSQSRIKWWISKCFWNVTTVTVMYISIWFVTLFFTVYNRNINFYPSEDICKEVLDITFMKGGIEFSLIVILLPYIMSIGISLIQMALSLVIGPIFSFSLVLTINILSAYFLNPYLIGNYSMMIRNSYVIHNGVNFLVGLIISVTLSIFAVLFGAVYFKTFDILE